MKKYVKTAYVIVFVVLFIAPMFTYELFGEYLDQTNFEQRQATEKPVLSWSTLEEYPEAFEAYYNDSLPWRNQMIAANNLLNLSLFRFSSVEKVIVGEDGWLFYNPSGKDGDPIADYQGTNLLTDGKLAMFADNLVNVRNTLESQGKEFVVLIAPNKECVYGNEYLPTEYKTKNTYTIGDQVAEYLATETDLKVIYPKASILNAMENDSSHIYYYKTDTHWNALGAYIGTRELLNKVGVVVPPLVELEISVKNMKDYDLTRMLGLSYFLKYEMEYFLEDYCKEQQVQHIYPIEGSEYLELCSTSNADERALLMVRDSFGTAMIPYLSTQFNECSFIHYDMYTPDVINQYPSDIVVLEVVERHIWRLVNFKVGS